MNPEQLLAKVEKQVYERPASANDRWALVLRNRKILCLPVSQLRPLEITIARLNRDEAVDGFTIPKWNRIKKQLFNLLKAGKL